MARLIDEAHRVLRDRGIALAILVPAEEGLFGFYERFDYEQVFDKSKEPVYPLDKILKEVPDLKSAYRVFDSLYRHRDFCVQKTFPDFKTIVEEYSNDHSPDRYNLAGMARIIDEEYLLSLFAQKNRDKTVCLRLKDCTYFISGGMVRRVDSEAGIDVSRRLLCRLLFGYKTNELCEPLRGLFPEHHPVMNLMLE
jgi:predicted acetyltransferase